MHTESQAEQAYRKLRSAVLTGRLAQDSVWSDQQLCERTELGCTPVREALSCLLAEQLVQILARKGTRIVPLCIEDLREIHQIVKALELEAALILAQRPDSAEDLGQVG